MAGVGASRTPKAVDVAPVLVRDDDVEAMVDVEVDCETPCAELAPVALLAACGATTVKSEPVTIVTGAPFSLGDWPIATAPRKEAMTR